MNFASASHKVDRGSTCLCFTLLPLVHLTTKSYPEFYQSNIRSKHNHTIKVEMFPYLILIHSDKIIYVVIGRWKS